MACVEHQVLEIVRFVNEEVVDAHLSEICNIIRPVLYILFQLFKFGLKVFLSFFQPLLYPAAHFIALLLEYCEILFDAVYFLRIYFLLYFGANMEKNIASTSLGFPAYLATPPCDNGISCANKGWNLTFAGLCLNSKALSEIICRILYFISYNLYFFNFSIEFQS